MAARRRRNLLFPLRTRPLRPQHLLVVVAAAAASFITVLFFVFVLLSTTSPSSPPSGHHAITRYPFSHLPPHDQCGAAGLAELGDALVSMLPTGLPFTVFAPSADAFRRVLNLSSAARATKQRHTTTTAVDADDNTYAVLSPVLGFSAVPPWLRAADAGWGGGVVLDSVSELRIHVAWDGGDGALVANGVRAECIDIVRGEALVHVMAGVLMDAEFERSFAVRSGS